MTHDSDNIDFAWQFIAIVILLITLILAIANNLKQKEINLFLEEKVDLMKTINKKTKDTIALRKALKGKHNKILLLEQNIFTLKEQINTMDIIVNRDNNYE